MLLSANANWTSGASNVACVAVNAGDQSAEMEFVMDESGRLRNMSMQRWGNPEGAEFHSARFGAIEDESTFGGYTIPTKLRIGGYFGTKRFETEGEFFRYIVDHATFQ